MKEIVKRIKSKTPIFFKNVQKFGAVIIALGVYLSNPVGLPDNFTIPDIFEKIGGYLIFVGGAIAAVSQLTVENAE